MRRGKEVKGHTGVEGNRGRVEKRERQREGKEGGRDIHVWAEKVEVYRSRGRARENRRKG